MKRLTLWSMLLLCALSSIHCSKKAEPGAIATDVSLVPIKPVPLPDPGIPNFHFPEPEATIDQWINSNDMPKEYLHSWGIWTALNANSGQKYNGEDLRVFETWLTPDDMAAAINAKQQKAPIALEAVPRNRGTLKDPNQSLHARHMHKLKLGQEIPQPVQNRILGFVKYDPTAAQFTIDNTLLDSTTLQSMINAGKTDIPDFPNTAITTKPVFNIITKSTLDSNGGYYKLPVWSGPNDTSIGYPSSAWPGSVWVDPKNQGQGHGGVDTGQGRSPQNTYNLDEFVHFKLDKKSASYIKASYGIDANEGDYAILVAMHVTSREIKRWTWQTFWWAPNADAPPAPSSKAIADARPSQLTGAPRHYAMAVAYTFIDPNQPYTNGNNIGTSIYTFNPYLEAGFDTSVFYEKAIVMTKGKPIVNDVGVHTNCMSCHALANFNPGNLVPTGPGYMADTYIDMDGKRFKGVLKLDFLWSIQGNIIEDSTKK
ncbi:MAG: hypothetical protein JSS75_08415 [Bacteroidetes bacterium]|nr:hypothetical protein [Bacteroidota bacterium]